MRLAVFGLALLSLIGPAPAQEGRTLIDRMALDTPEQAVQSLIEAFAAEDYLSVYFILTPQAKEEFAYNYATFNVAQYFVLRDTGWIDGSFHSSIEDIDEERLIDLRNDVPLIFDDIVLHATANGQMPFSLADGMIQSSTPGDEDVVQVEVSADGQTLTIEAREVYTGDWRIDRIGWPGSDPEGRPWGIGTKAKSKS
ncbi:hypothetical protein [Devosia sediminis]|uniref:Uncharacterized protein n=1 Tax=Devosia sediminis TaxID=2798801 RepID=A0A934IR85_9HYPH|nr:hypothetical protein [Devosia sediminis]MBJ3785334.1 hypothetical protein [Devosia sediminis]